MKCSEIIEGLQRLAPESCACDWDNPGLLAGRSDKEVKKIYIALDATDQVVEDAVQWGADMLLTHHPLIFKAIKKVNDGNFITRRLVKLIQADISYYAMHTNFDAAPGCMADMAAARLGLTECEPLDPMGELDMDGESVPYGVGKRGTLEQPVTVRELAERVKEAFGLPFVLVYGQEFLEKPVSRIAVCPGAGGSTLEEGIRWGAQAFVTGDISHHTGIDAAARGMAVIDGGHYGLEHMFISYMEEHLKGHLGDAVEIRKAAPAWPAVLL
ncbi:MAG TPA: Nif3-like dinuclear metal center hexameric protein [Candidatus Enterocloster excrementipullorum]|uniref:GTP cyclohydrolase 1 type 2 homolog n=1 Tax=Candidatus Enterocloster excrementipullorum TaxID=2838559 RepID=A0A9D2N2B5_9FIRM|nr:Nif3-like dinuclear metal center hexameric protein [Candidatus Enterocloster excrementipullorum]